MALVYIDTDPWLKEYETCDKLYRDIMGQLVARKQESQRSPAFAHLSAAIRLRMKQFSSEVVQLSEKLNSDSNITPSEAERRSRLVEQLKTREIQLMEKFNERNDDYIKDHSSLLSLQRQDFTNAGPSNLGEDANDKSSETLRKEQQKLLADQDAGLEALAQVISRQKQIADTVGTEVDLQNELIDDIATHVDRTNEGLISGTQQVRFVDSKDKGICVYWVIIIVLFIAILVVALL